MAEIIENESSYAILTVWILLVIGILSVMFLNLYFKIIGLITILASTTILYSIYKKKEVKDE